MKVIIDGKEIILDDNIEPGERELDKLTIEDISTVDEDKTIDLDNTIEVTEEELEKIKESVEFTDYE